MYAMASHFQSNSSNIPTPFKPDFQKYFRAIAVLQRGVTALLLLFLILILVACGGEKSEGRPGDSDTSRNSAEITVGGRATLAIDKSLKGAAVKLDEINLNIETQQGRFNVIGESVVDSNGQVQFLLPDELDDARLYQVSASCPTPTTEACPIKLPIAAVMTGARLKQGGWSINLLTEIVSENLGYYIAAEYSELELQQVMAEEAQALIKLDIDGSGEIDYEDLLQWDLAENSDAIRSPGTVQQIQEQIESSTDNNAFQLVIQELSQRIVGNLDALSSPSVVAVADGYAYVGGSNSVHLLVDLSNPNEPVPVSGVDTGVRYVEDIVLSGGYAYLVSDDLCLQIVDIRNPNDPVAVGRLETPEGASAISVSNGYAYVAAGGSGLQIIDVSDPNAPAIVESFNPSEFDIHDVFVSDGYAYLVDHNYGLQIVDVSNPIDPVIEGNLATSGYISGVAVSNGYAYLAHDDFGLQIVDIRIKDKPVVVTSVTTPGLDGVSPDIADGITVHDDFAYVSNRNSGLQIIDVSNPELPNVVGNVPMPILEWTYLSPDGVEVDLQSPSEITDVYVRDGYAYVTTGGSGLLLVDIRHRTAPVNVGRLNISAWASDVAVYEDFAYVAALEAGLQIVDVSNPGKPTTLNSIETEDSTRGVTVNEDYLYLAEDWSGVRIVDIGNPIEPEFITFASDYVTDAEKVAVLDGYTYIANSGMGLQIVDTTVPTAPVTQGNIDTPGSSRDVVVSNGYAYLADGESGLQVVNINVPLLPFFATTVATPDSARALKLSEGYMYLADGESGLQILDLSDPASPVIVSNVDTPDFAVDVAVSNGYAYVADSSSGVQIFDVSNPADPSIIGRARTIRDALSVEISGDYLYVGTKQGLMVLKAIRRGAQ
jgi:hypothetical protein